MSEKVSIDQFKGIKNDTDAKQTSFEYFRDIINLNYQDSSVLGLQKTVCPSVLNFFEASSIDGIYEYRFLNSNNILQKKIIVVCNGSIYETDLNTKTLIKSGLHTGKCSFAVYQDNLFITNGIDNIQVYYGADGTISEMGAPLALVGNIGGALTGTYKYAVTYVTAGGEEILGSISNSVTVSAQNVLLKLPIGYDGTLTRKLYRTKNGGSILYYVQAIANNTTLEIYDNLLDEFLETKIGEVNNELPKPYFLVCAGSKLFGGKVSKYPTQLFPTGVNGQIFDSASFIDVSNFGVDNTAIEGLGEDFNKVVVGTGKNIFFINPDDNSVVLTRANVGILDGYSVAKCPSFANFAGGLMFVSTERDIRLMSGLQALPVATSLDNITTTNYAQNIQGSLPNDLRSYVSMSSIFFNYKYMLQIDSLRYVFDIRNSAWTKQKILTETYMSNPTYLTIINEQLINGQSDGYLEVEYSDIKYKGEECPAYIESVEINASSQFSFIEKLYFWFTTTEENNLNIEVITDSNQSYRKDSEFKMIDGAFNSDYSNLNFNENQNGMDYRIYNIYQPCRWFKYKLTITEGNLVLQNFEISGQTISNKE